MKSFLKLERKGSRRVGRKVLASCCAFSAIASFSGQFSMKASADYNIVRNALALYDSFKDSMPPIQIIDWKERLSEIASGAVEAPNEEVLKTCLTMAAV